MSNITSIPRKVNEDSREVASFLSGRKSDKRMILESLKDDIESAIEQPDTRRAPQRTAPVAVAEPQGEGAAARSESPPQQEPAPQAPAAALPDSSPEAEAKPAPAKKPSGPQMVEKSFTIDKDQYKLIVRYSNMEGLRLEKNVSSSEIVRRLLDFALAHVDHTKGDVLAMMSPDRRAAK